MIIFDKFQERNPQKFVNHRRNIVAFPQLNEDWFQSVLFLYGMKDICMTSYALVNHDMLNAFLERWHSETSSFHLSHGEMSITLDDVLCLLHLHISGRFLDHGRITKDEAVEMMVEYLGVDPKKVIGEVDKTRGSYSRFEFLRNILRLSSR